MKTTPVLPWYSWYGMPASKQAAVPPAVMFAIFCHFLEDLFSAVSKLIFASTHLFCSFQTSDRRAGYPVCVEVARFA